MLCALSEELVRMGYDVRVAALVDVRHGQSAFVDQATAMGLDVTPIRCDGRLDLGAIRALRALVRETKAQLVHSHGYKTDFYSYAATLRMDVARVATCHNWPDPRRLMQLYARMDRLILRLFDRVATPSEVVADTLQRSGVDPQKIALIPNGISLSRFLDVSPRQRPHAVVGPVIGFVGRMVPEKGGDLFLKAASLVLREFPTTRFVFAGDGPCRASWADLAESLGIAASVSFVGVVSDMPAYYASLNLLVQPSLREAMPMSLLEAMASSLPVVATSVGAVPSLIEHDRTGMLIAPDSVPQIVEAVLGVLRDPRTSLRIGRAARAHVQQLYSAERMARRYLELFSSLDTTITPVLTPTH